MSLTFLNEEENLQNEVEQLLGSRAKLPTVVPQQQSSQITEVIKRLQTQFEHATGALNDMKTELLARHVENERALIEAITEIERTAQRITDHGHTVIQNMEASTSYARHVVEVCDTISAEVTKIGSSG